LLERQSEVWHRLGDLDYRTDRPAANAAYRKAVAIRERLAADHPAEPRFRMALSRSFNGVAITTKPRTEQLDAYRRSLELRLKLAGEIPEDPDLLHGVSESLMNLGFMLRGSWAPVEARELITHSIEYGRAGLARRPHDLEFAIDLGAAYSGAADVSWQLGRREEALAISAEGIAYLRKLTADNPDVPVHRTALANALGEHGRYLAQESRTEHAVPFYREASETLETMPDPDAGALATALFYRTRVAGLLAGDPGRKDFKSWPDAARHEADLAVADLKAAVARGSRRLDIVLANPLASWFRARDDVKAILAQIERSPAQPAPAPAPPPAKVKAARAPSPLDQPGRLEEDRFLGELAIGLLEGAEDNSADVRARLEAMLGRIEERRARGPRSPTLEESAQSVRMRIGEELWKAGELARAKQLWDEVFFPPRRKVAAAEPGRVSVPARFARAMQRISELFAEHGLWEQAADYDAYYRAGNPDGRFYRCYESGVLALARGDVAAYRDIAAEGVDRLPEEGDFWIGNAVRTATLRPVDVVSPEKLVEMAKPLVDNDRTDFWYRITLGNALFRAGRDAEAIAALEEHANGMNGKAVVALIHARAGRSDQARRWLLALERDLEAHIRAGHVSFGALRRPRYWPFDPLRADLLRREAYASLRETAPELRALRLLRGDSLWRLNERAKAEIEFTAAVTRAPDEVAALVDRARTFDTLGAHDRADADLAEAARQKPDDPRPWVARGRLLAERGLGAQADAAYARAAGLAQGRLDPFLEAGWWVAGPYPEDMSWPQPPEANPDPAVAVAGESGLPLRWKPATVNEDRYVHLGLIAGRRSSSVYAMTHLASDRERTALLCLSAGDRVRVWLNGRLVFDKDQPHIYHNGPEFLAPVTLRAGRNTLLARVSHHSGDQGLRLRAADFELDHASLLAEFARWPEAAELFDRADKRGQMLAPWPLARQIELLAALGDREGYLRRAARLADFDGTIRPDPYDAAVALGILPSTLWSADRLIERAREAIAVNPAEAWRKLPLGLAYYRAGRFREALEHLKEHVPAPNHLAAPIRAMAHWRLGEKDEARKSLAGADGTFETWCRERSDGRGTVWANWWYDGPQLVALRREAHELIDGKAPDDKGALTQVRSAMGTLIDDCDSPTWAYDLALRLEPGNAGYRDSLAARLIELGRLAEAEPLLAAIVEGKTDQPRAWVDRGLLLAQAGEPERAAADFARALELLPEEFLTFGPRSTLCCEMAALPAAYDRLLELRPSDALAWYIRAGEHLIRQEWTEAVADFVRGGEPPATNEFAYEYAAALLLAGNETEYHRYVARQAELYGESTEPFTFYVLARLAMLAERPPVPADRIVEWASRALKQEPNVAWYAHARALALLRAGDMEAASAAALAAKRIPWGSASALHDVALGMINLRRGHADLARDVFERARASLDRPVAQRPVAGQVMLLDWLEFQILRSQIEGPLFDAVFPADPFGR
jgi:tetratricopeptide (TPR) repeat protein